MSLQHLRAVLHQFRQPAQVELAGGQRLFKPGGSQAQILLEGQLAHVFGVEPASASACRRWQGALLMPVQVEDLFQFFQREDFLLALGTPAQKGNEVDDGFASGSPDPADPQRRDRRSAWKASAGRCAMTGGRWMYFGGSQPKAWYRRLYLGAEERYSVPRVTWVMPIGVVVDDVGEVVGGQPVGLDQHVVVQGRAVHLHMAVEQVVEAGLALGGHVLADDVRLARRPGGAVTSSLVRCRQCLSYLKVFALFLRLARAPRPAVPWCRSSNRRGRVSTSCLA